MTGVVGLLIFAGALLVALAGVIGVLTLRDKRPAILAVVCGLSYLLGARAGSITGSENRNGVLISMTVRSRPLIQAIRWYDGATGRPPDSLRDLVSDYLPEVPGTGILAYPTYQYESGVQHALGGRNPWQLRVSTPIGFMNMDRFVYLPKQNYSEIRFRSGAFQLADWIYLPD